MNIIFDLTYFEFAHKLLFNINNALITFHSLMKWCLNGNSTIYRLSILQSMMQNMNNTTASILQLKGYQIMHLPLRCCADCFEMTILASLLFKCNELWLLKGWTAFRNYPSTLRALVKGRQVRYW